MTKEREALKLALEAVEHLSHNARKAGVEMGLAFVVADEAITAIKEALAQPEQEPVACVIDGDLYFHHEIDWEDLAYQGHGVELLYTTPPAAQRQWVGLTDEEIDKTEWEPSYENPMTLAEGLQLFARAIEAKLKQKNGFEGGA
jgi:hypothetical protein